MKEIARFKVGSKYFFDGIEGFESKDNDYVIIMDEWKIKRTNIMRFTDKEKNDNIICRNMTKEEFIDDALKSEVPIKCGKFLVKEFNEYIGFTIEDLPQLHDMFQKMDEKHLYEKRIYECFLENGSFELNNKQREECFKIYEKGKS